MPIIVPNTASVYDSAASVPLSANRWAWLGFVNAPGLAGCVVWYAGTAASAGSPLLPIVGACGVQGLMQGPFNSSTGFFAASITNGCAVIWLKSGS